LFSPFGVLYFEHRCLFSFDGGHGHPRIEQRSVQFRPVPAPVDCRTGGFIPGPPSDSQSSFYSSSFQTFVVISNKALSVS
jgi:hypothetical protein